MTDATLKDIVFITLPESMGREINGFRVDPARRIPVQLPDGKTAIDASDEITVEMIISGMLKLIAWRPEDPNHDYYRAFVLAAEPDAVEQLNLAAIAQEKQGHLEFAEELFLTVCHLSPQSATFINLATLYSERAAKDTSKGTVYDLYAQKALDTLLEGLKQFPKDADLLCEVGYFHLYQGNTEAARNFFEQYLAVAPQGDKRTKVEKVFSDITNKITNDTELLGAYDKIQMGEEDKAVQALDAYIAKNPTVWNAYFLKGWALRRLEEFEPAKDAFLKCLSLGERDGDIYNELSLCEFSLGNKELAKTYLDTAVDLDETNLTYLSNLAYLHLKDEEYTEARRLLEKARVIDGNDPLIQQLMKDYATQTGDSLSEQPVEERVVDDETLQEEVKKQDAKEAMHDFSAHREDMEETDDEGEHHHHHHHGEEAE
ncbi:MAG: tetratricopeptide repeat protein [Sphaerochaeta sp.]|jgi:Flp pilus assembly protein TadD|nr:tetratricopeptide repeat protein [Sphaerochaeta sp.]MCI2097022.1 tetratricopeptide repeat protein [Sphaerochaeta sp.]MCI2103828.1 tetratricopeptide repeat protein [Sphaerochaeta sp.]